MVTAFDLLAAIWDFDMSASRFDPDGLKGTPCIRCTPELDFLRGEPGSVTMGDFLDDGTLSQLPMKFLKAFLDAGLYESMYWARWGATKWVSNEPQAVADNSYGSSVEERLLSWATCLSQPSMTLSRVASLSPSPLPTWMPSSSARASLSTPLSRTSTIACLASTPRYTKVVYRLERGGEST